LGPTKSSGFSKCGSCLQGAQINKVNLVLALVGWGSGWLLLTGGRCSEVVVRFDCTVKIIYLFKLFSTPKLIDFGQIIKTEFPKLFLVKLFTLFWQTKK
jgi:hypothetical protein